MVKDNISEFTPQKLKEKILDKKTIWKSLEPLVVTKSPSLEEELTYIL